MSRDAITSLEGIYKRLHRHGEPFYGILATTRAIDGYPMSLDADYQRGHVWTTGQQEKFVGHLLEGGDVSPCIVNEGPEGKMSPAKVVDGKQRITACLKWAIGEIFARLYDGHVIWANDLDEKSRRECTMSIGLRYAMVRLTRKECLELYIKINRGGTVHTYQEIAKVRQLLEAE